MKECPRCKRSYDDELSFCLEDGSWLSAAFDSEQTLVIPHSITAPQAATRSSGQQIKGRIVLYTIVLFSAISFTVGAVLLLRQKTTDSTPASQTYSSPEEASLVTPKPSDSSIKTAKSDDRKDIEPDIKTSWLEGVWEGAAYQTNTGSTWTIKFTARGTTYTVEYPSLTCGGKWILVGLGAEMARFKERITYGLSRCVDNGDVTIERLGDSQIRFKYNEQNSTVVIARAVLNKN